ncbi:MAG: DUF305 domain-containing protein [Hyphomicrobiales bacterium]
MKKIAGILGSAALVVGIGSAVMAQSHMQHQSMDPAAMQKMMTEMVPAASDPASTKAFKETHMTMMKAMHITYTGNADVDFMRGMIPHHQGAIDMAKVLLAHGKDEETRKLAQQIIADQEKEIAQMQAWLKKNAK